MPRNDPATDSLNYAGASGVSSVDFDELLFEEIEEGDLFWFSDSPNSDINHAFRKTDESTASNTRSQRITEGIGNRTTVYQKI